MRYLTDRKRAVGLGASGGGTQHHWKMIVSSILMVIAVPVFIFTFGAVYGGSYEEVIAFFKNPVAAIVVGLTMTVIINHVKHEVHEAIEDYMHGTCEKMAIVATSALANILIVAGLFSLVKIAL
ncbi:succinate dehydrogenase, hydrophobic membrane anchor protein [Thioclava sp. GXIMD4216]|uniref:Succinate dehydrogenase hydrophobic membrane anchor subunit n=1 Tax=Thioclava litoralis TaxID=3076557 RepID=A0ABZ1DXV9_9RHOB|nr:succinate dehydrogenase, hydrophobic membrane anchor protein [Thioclava sp. FTW29]